MADIAIGFAKDWELIELRSKTMGMTDHNLEILHGAFLKDPEQDLNGFVQMLLKTQEIREQCKEPEPVVEEPVNELPEIEFDDEGEIMEWHKVEILCSDRANKTDNNIMVVPLTHSIKRLDLACNVMVDSLHSVAKCNTVMTVGRELILSKYSEVTQWELQHISAAVATHICG